MPRPRLELTTIRPAMIVNLQNICHVVTVITKLQEDTWNTNIPGFLRMAELRAKWKKEDRCIDLSSSVTAKVIINKSRGEGFLAEQDTIENSQLFS